MQRLLAKLFDAGVETFHEIVDFLAAIGDPLLGGFHLPVDKGRNFIDGQVHLVQIFGTRLAQGVFNQFFPITAPRREPGSDTALGFFERVFVSLLGTF